MRRLLAALLLAPAVAAAQLRPAPLVATRELYIAADSARAFVFTEILRDRNGTLFFDRLTDTVNIFATVVVAAHSNGQVRHTGPAGAPAMGSVRGWIRFGANDSLWIQHDNDDAILMPGHAPVKVGARWRTDLGSFADTLILGAPSGLRADGSTVWVALYFESMGKAEALRSQPGLLIRAGPGTGAPRVVAMIPPGVSCVQHDREGHAMKVSPMCNDFRYHVAPSGARIAEAFRLPDQLGVTVVSLKATGDTIFRRTFALPRPILPDRPFADVASNVDTTASAAASPLWIAEQHGNLLGTVIAGDDGTTWVELEGGETLPHRWIEIDAHGALVGELDLPPEIVIRGGLRDRVWGAVRNGEGMQAGVVMYKIRKP